LPSAGESLVAVSAELLSGASVELLDEASVDFCAFSETIFEAAESFSAGVAARELATDEPLRCSNCSSCPSDLLKNLPPTAIPTTKHTIAPAKRNHPLRCSGEISGACSRNSIAA
jgi:hypothetical protein